MAFTVNSQNVPVILLIFARFRACTNSKNRISQNDIQEVIQTNILGDTENILQVYHNAMHYWANINRNCL